MSRKDQIYLVGEKKKKSRAFTYIFFGILGFIAVWVPFFGMNLQYQVGTLFYIIFSKLGDFCVFIGWILLGFTIIGVLVARKIYLKLLIACVVLLWVGYFLTGQIFVLFGFQLGPIQNPGSH